MGTLATRSPRRLGDRRKKPAERPWNRDFWGDSWASWHEYDTHEEERPYYPPGNDVSLSCRRDTLLPRSEVERQALAWRPRLFPEQSSFASPRLASLVGPASYSRLQRLVQSSAAVEFPDEIRSFLEVHGLTWPVSGVVDTIPRLALRVLLGLHGLGGPDEIDWGSLEERLLGMLVAPSPGALLAPLLAFHEAISRGPEALREALSRTPWHEDWLPLAPWLAATWIPAERERILAHARGSGLALAAVKAWLEGPRKAFSLDRGRTSGAGGAAALVMATGGGSLRGLDYPEFRLLSRTCLAELSPAQLTTLREIRTSWLQIRGMVGDPARGLPALLALVAPSLWDELDREVRGSLVATLLRSLRSYVGLRNDPAMASVRLRRSHLVAFWQRLSPDHRSLDLRYLYPRERASEGLVLALLSELHQPLVADDGLQLRLKEALIEAARLVASCHGVDTLTDVNGAVDSLATGVLLNELLRCFDHAPLELLQELGFDPRQGLPRLQGGQGSRVNHPRRERRGFWPQRSTSESETSRPSVSASLAGLPHRLHRLPRRFDGGSLLCVASPARAPRSRPRGPCGHISGT
jgi:hypothetical protein